MRRITIYALFFIFCAFSATILIIKQNNTPLYQTKFKSQANSQQEIKHSYKENDKFSSSTSNSSFFGKSRYGNRIVVTSGLLKTKMIAEQSSLNNVQANFYNVTSNIEFRNHKNLKKISFLIDSGILDFAKETIDITSHLECIAYLRIGSRLKQASLKLEVKQGNISYFEERIILNDVKINGNDYTLHTQSIEADFAKRVVFLPGKTKIELYAQK